MRKVRLLAAVVVATAAAVAIGLWLARDQPRRIVQSALAERLDAEVTVGSLHVDGLSAARLGDVVIRMNAAPGLREIRIAEIAVPVRYFAEAWRALPTASREHPPRFVSASPARRRFRRIPAASPPPARGSGSSAAPDGPRP